MTAPASASEVPADPLDDLDPIARWIVVVATSEARLARHPEVSSAHVVLAAWLAVGTPLGAALRDAGFSGRIAKAWLEHEVRPEERSDEPVVDDRLLSRARSIATENNAVAIRAIHLFQAATESAESDGVRMIRAQGISPARIQATAAQAPGTPPITTIVERLDEEAQAIVVAAGEFATQLGHSRVRIGHLLMALTSVGSAAQVMLHDAKVTPEATRLAFRSAHGPEDGPDPQPHIPFGDDAQQVLHEAGSGPSGRVSALDLLAAVMGRDHGDHIEIMHTLGTDFERLQRTLGIVDEETAGGTAPSPGHEGLDGSGVDRESGRAAAHRATTETVATVPEPARRRPNLSALRIDRSHGRRPNQGWRPELVLVALIYLGTLAEPADDPLTALGLAMAAIGAVAVGAGALIRARSRRGPWRTVRLFSAGALCLAATGVLLGAAFS